MYLYKYYYIAALVTNIDTKWLFQEQLTDVCVTVNAIKN